MALPVGTRVGPYDIVSLIGAGGMGEVYRARDGRLERDVAIKVLPELLATDPERLARFEREARVLASLNHPNIAAIYGVEEFGGLRALVLELVEGRGLETEIARGPMPLGDVLRLSIQIADALCTAHAAGIIHRDLKPANIIITNAGAAKVLDFGLARVSAVDSFSATMTAHGPAQATAEGAVMGTVAYMSPEQAAGRPIDAPSDIFSFGSVLFEMITGARAFEGDTTMSTLAAIINQPARLVSQVNAAVPRELERIISRCHRKDPAKRAQSMGDVRVALEELRDEFDSGRLPTASPGVMTAPRAAGPRWLLFAAVAVAAAVLGAFGARALVAPAVDEPDAIALRHLTADVGLTDDPAVTPNGSLVAYASDRFDATSRDIWVQPAAGGDPVRVTTHPADDSEPAFSPDGSRLAFRSERDGGGIYVVPALGGAERLLVRDGRAPSFSPDGKWLMYLTGGRGSAGSVFVMPASGGSARRVFEKFRIGGPPIWAPDSARIALVGSRDGVVDIYIGGIDDASGASAVATSLRPRLDDPGSFVLRAWKGDRLFLSTELALGAIWRVDFRGGKAGAITPVHQSTSRIGRVAVDDAGQVYFSSFSDRTSLWSVPEQGVRAITEPPVLLTASSATDDWPSMSSDGATLAFRSTRRDDAGVWIRDVRQGTEAALPSGGRPISVVLSPDGRTVAYVSRIEGTSDTQIMLVGAAGGVPRALCQKCAHNVWAWTADGKGLLAASGRPLILSLIDVDTANVTPLVETHPDRIWLARSSPDGRWVSFIDWPAADRTRIYIAPFTHGAPMPEASWIAVTDGATVDEEQAWSADGRTLYFVSERDGSRCLHAAPFDPAGARVGPAQPILHAHGVRRRIVSTANEPGRIDAGGGRLVLPMQELHGNIYALTIARNGDGSN